MSFLNNINNNWSLVDLDTNEIIPCVMFEFETIAVPSSIYGHLPNHKSKINCAASINPNIEPDAKWAMDWVSKAFEIGSKRNLGAVCFSNYDRCITLYGAMIESYESNVEDDFFSTIKLNIGCDYYEVGVGFEATKAIKLIKRDDSLNKLLGF